MTFRVLSKKRLSRRAACWLATIGLIQTLFLAGTVTAQGPPAGNSPVLPRVPDKPARTTADLGVLVDGVDQNDAVFSVTLGQGKILVLKQDIAIPNKPSPFIAVGDPSVVDFEIVGPRQIRVVGMRMGVTDLSITTSDQGTISFEVQVLANFKNLRSQLAASFRDASVNVSQLEDHVIVEGQARDTQQVERILEMVRAFLSSQAARVSSQSSGLQAGATAPVPQAAPTVQTNEPGDEPEGADAQRLALIGTSGKVSVGSSTTRIPQVINLLQVPGSQQVMLRVQVAELNRTAFRQLGTDFSVVSPDFSIATTLSSILNPPTVNGTFTAGSANVSYIVSALRRNNVLRILAEPNLVAYHGHEATFLAGGEFPVPIAQTSGGLSSSPAITVQFKEFGVRLGFVPYILDNERIRLTVKPEVSNIDRTLSTTLIAGGAPVPGLSSRKMTTTVEIRHGETLAMAGLLQVTLDAQTRRIPLFGDTPIIGPLFSNNTGERVEKELVVLVTPLLVDSVPCDTIGPKPGDEVQEPNDLEFYLLGRIESRVGRDFRSTTRWDDRFRSLIHRRQLDERYLEGPHGYSEVPLSP